MSYNYDFKRFLWVYIFRMFSLLSYFLNNFCLSVVVVFVLFFFGGGVCFVGVLGGGVGGGLFVETSCPHHAKPESQKHQ